MPPRILSSLTWWPHRKLRPLDLLSMPEVLTSRLQDNPMSAEYFRALHIPITKKEHDAIRELEEKHDLCERGVVLQALRLYQAVANGYATVSYPPQKCKIYLSILKHDLSLLEE